MALAKAVHISSEGMILQLRIELLIDGQPIQYGGKQRLKIIAISRTGLQLFEIPLELASPINLPHSIDPSTFGR